MNNNLLSGINIAKIASNLNKTLGVINKAIPIYLEFKPIFKNASSLTNILNMINSKNDNVQNDKKPIVKQEKKVSNNLPTFFQ